MIKNGQFIWTPDQLIDTTRNFRTLLRDGPGRRDDGINRYYYFRREYHLASLPSEANVNLFVDGRYKLFVNGAFVGRGPSRASPDFPRYDVLDIRSFLNQGTNTVAVLVLSYGVDTAWYERATNYWQCVFGDGGLHFSGDIKTKEGVARWQSDESWRCLPAQAWNRETPRIGWGLGFIEDYDANKVPSGWDQNGFDDSTWAGAQSLVLDGGFDDEAKGFAPIRPFPMMSARKIPHLASRYHVPVNLLSVNLVHTDDSLSIDQKLYEEIHEPSASADLVSRIGVQPKFPLVLPNTGKGDMSLLFKFDKLHSGLPILDIEAAGGEVIEIATAETLPGEFEAGAALPNRLVRESYLDGAHIMRYKAKPGRQQFEKFELGAVRYLQLVIRNVTREITVHALSSNELYYPATVQGSFESSDSMLNRLWQMGAYTIAQCSHDAWEDCPSREQRQWLGDGVVRYPAAAVSFGPSMQALDQNFIDQCAESQRPDGLLQMFAPGDHNRTSIVIPDFSLHWINVVSEYTMQTNDIATLAHAYPTIEKVLSWFARNIGPSGLLEDIPYWHFIEWAHTGRSGAACAINALYIGALRMASKLADVLSYDSARERYTAEAYQLAERLNQSHWSEERGAYVDEIAASGDESRVSQQANALMICFDIAPTDRQKRIASSIADMDRVKLTAVPPVTRGDPEFDAAQHMVKANSFFAHFVYSALAKCGRFDLALDAIRGAYQPMMVETNGTLWESFEPTTSLCHAFSASPVYQLSTHLLGVRPIEPGFAKFEVAIQPCDLVQVQGTYPTVKGNIEVSWQRLDDQITLQLKSPGETEGCVTVPEGWRHEHGELTFGGGTSTIRLRATIE